MDTDVEGVAYLPAIGRDEGFFSLGNGSVVGVKSVLRHGEFVADVQPVVASVPLDGAAASGPATVTQSQRCGAFGGVVHAPDFGEFLSPGQVVAELLEHAAAVLHRGQLIWVANGEGFDTGLGAGGE